MGGAVKVGSLYCAAHQRKLTEEDLKTRNCIKQPCKHLSRVIASKQWNVKGK